jgi:hypothetical protein
MKAEYRIANRAGGYYPQVRFKRFIFWGQWKKIAVHPRGFGTYDLPNWKYPQTKEECEKIISDFHKWYHRENTDIVCYTKFEF